MCCSHSFWTQCKYTPGLFWQCQSLNEQVFYIFSLLLIVYLLFFSFVLYMLLHMCCCNLYLLLLRRWQESNLSRAVSTFQCNKKVRSFVFPPYCFKKSIMQPLLDVLSRMLSPPAPELGPNRLKKCIPEQILPWCCDKRLRYQKLEKPLSKCETQVTTSRLHICFLTVFSF